MRSAPTTSPQRPNRARLSSLLGGMRKKQLIAVRIVHLQRVVPPPDFLCGNGAFCELAANILEGLRCQADEHTSSVSTRCVFTENDLALSMIHLANRSRAVA